MESNNNCVIVVTIVWHHVACIAYFVTSIHILYSLTNVVNQLVGLIRWHIWCCMKSLGLGPAVLVLKKVLFTSLQCAMRCVAKKSATFLNVIWRRNIRF